MTARETFRKAADLYGAGKHDEAAVACLEILAEAPDHFDALHLLGVLRARSGDAEEAARLIGEAVKIRPDSVRAQVNLGNLLAETDRKSEALSCLDAAVALKPNEVAIHFARANLLWNMGRLADAAAGFEHVIALHPAAVEALVNLGSVLAELGRKSDALASYDAALALKPDVAHVHFVRGSLLWETGRLEEAAAAFETAVALKQPYVEALVNLSNVLQDLKRYEDALKACERAVAVAPDMPEVHNNRGNALLKLDRMEEALECYERAIALKPDFPMALFNRGNALAALKRDEQALESYSSAITLKPDLALAYNGRAAVHIRLERPREALEDCERALALDPALVMAHNYRACALNKLMRFKEAMDACDAALALKPDCAEAYDIRGAVLGTLGRYREAMASFDRAIALDPGMAEAFHNRSGILNDLGRLEEALRDCEKALSLKPDLTDAVAWRFLLASHLCDWRGRDELISDLRRSFMDNRCANPFSLLYVFDEPQFHLDVARKFAGKTVQPLAKQPAVAHGRLRIAYLSADFFEHPVSLQAVELFEQHDHNRFETYGICVHPGAPPSSIRDRLKNAFDHFVEPGRRTDHEIAQFLTGLQIDIAVELGGYTKNARPKVHARRPMPITVNFLGYPGTLGADYIDYIIADEQVIPPGSEEFYAEHVVRLPDCFLPRDTKGREDATPASRAEVGLPERGLVFCCFNKASKFTPEIFDIWMRLLREVEGSVLWLSLSNPKTSDNLRAEAAARNVSPQRLIFSERVKSHEQHIARIGLADLFLDTLPYNAHATASDALWAGVPVLTCMGKSFAARVAGSMLTTIGAEELIAHDLGGYEAIALDLARSPERLAAVRAKLVRNRTSSPLFDTARLCRHLESAYETMWDFHMKGLKPESFMVNRLTERSES